MFTNIDFELYPDDCEVVEILPHNQYVYLIQKNGNTSLRLEAERSGYRVLKNQEIQSLDHVDVYIRDPRERYISGINTFLQHLKKQFPELDADTIVFMATRYLFLNRHYLPQWHWLLNLSRFLNKDCLICIHSMQELGRLTDINDHAQVMPPTQKRIDSILSQENNCELWFFIDQILLDLKGQSMTWEKLLEHYKQHPANPLKIVTKVTSMIHSQLNVLS